MRMKCENAMVLLALALLLLAVANAGAQTNAEGQAKFTPQQREALGALFDIGGVLIHTDDRRPGQPVILVDFTNHPKFQDILLKHLAPFPELSTVGLAGTALTDAGVDYLLNLPRLEALTLNDTALTDAGLAKLATCRALRVLDVRGTRVSTAGVEALRAKLPQLEVTSDADAPTTDEKASGEPQLTKFRAADLQQRRKQIVEFAQMPETAPPGWSKSRVDPARVVAMFSALRVRDGYVLRAYQFREEGNGNGFVWALPADAEFPEPEDCPRLDYHFLRPPKPLDALDDVMEAITGDDSAASYLQASLLRRELKDFGVGWHGIEWGAHTLLDEEPWAAGPPRDDESPMARPMSERREWRWSEAPPESWRPQVLLEKDRAIVTFYTYTPLAKSGEGDELEKERILRHTDTYRRGKYRALATETKIAEGPNALAF
ncbi:MAG: hypothetical protein RIC55_11890 [Pirellulaceae bacterium]